MPTLHLRPLLRLLLRRLRPVLVTTVAIGLLMTTAWSAAAAGGWSAPLHPITVTRPFELPPNPYAAGHRGVDLAGVAGQSVTAAAAGEISFAGNLAGRGVVVVVHGSLRTTYEPVKATVQRGTPVTRGERIGTLEPGHAGCPVSACLHWGLLRGERYLDPLLLLTRPQIRLLPPTGQVDDSVSAGEASLTVRPAAAISADPSAPPAPSGLAWSFAALAGGGMVLLLRRR